MSSQDRLYVCRNVPGMEIEAIDFGLLSPEVMNNIAQVEIVRDTHSLLRTTQQGTLLDPLMGPVTPNERCQVCGKTIQEGCLGHFGLIKLPEPVVNPLFDDAVVNTVNSIDETSGRILSLPLTKAAVFRRKLRKLQYKLRELEEKFYSGKISFEEFSSKYKEISKAIEAEEEKVIAEVHKAREEYIKKAREYLEKHGKAPTKFVRELRKQREEYINLMTPMLVCPKGEHKFYRMGHKTKKGEVVCPICGHKFVVFSGKAQTRYGVRSPYTDELINTYKLEEPRKRRDVYLIAAHKILIKPSVKKSKRSKRSRKKKASTEEVVAEIERTIVMEEEPEFVETRKIKKILERIPDDDALVLGRHPVHARPERAILEALIVPPNQVRAPTILQQGQQSESPRTVLYRGVLSAANQLRSSKGSQAAERTFMQMYNNLASAVYQLFDLKGAARNVEKRHKGLGGSLRGKKGLFRKHLTGKRVDFSARSVISPDPFLSINEVGVPYEVAKVLTVQELVNEYNLEFYLQLLRNGPDKYPGVKTVIFVDEDRNVEMFDPGVVLYHIIEAKVKESVLEDRAHVIVTRHMLDGDPVLFNRQPSLHRMSMMAFHARVLPYRTFRMNLAVCPPFNADFDGDEMNLHQLQLPEARVEAEMLMLAEKNIMSPRYGAPIIGGNEDHITASAMISYRESKVPKHIARHLLGFAGYDGEYPDEDIIMTRDLFSLLIPEKIHMRNRSRLCDAVFRHRCPFHQKLGFCPIETLRTEGRRRLIEKVKKRMEASRDKEFFQQLLDKLESGEELKCPFDVYMEIKGGKILSGVLDKFAVGAEQKYTIIHHIVRRYGVTEAGKFIDRAFRMALKFLTYHGFTVSAKDFDLPEEAFKIIKRVFEIYDKRIQELYEAFRTGRLIPEIGMTPEETFRARLRALLDELRDRAAVELIKYIIDRGLVFQNNVLIMTGTKARGDITQFAQMMVTVGAMTVRGQFISRGFTGRTLSHFKPGLLEPKAMGFVRSSFRLGMDPIEYFFQAAAGRDGLIDTATKTSDSGYLQRKMIHNLEDIVVEYDGTARTLYGDIVQFVYGEDGMDVSKTDYGTIDVNKIIQEVLDDLDVGIHIGLLKKKEEEIIARGE